MLLYQCLILGAPTPTQIAMFSSTLDECLGLFGLERGRDYTITRGIQAHFSDVTATVAVFFGAVGSTYPEAPKITRLGVPVVPVVSAAAQVAAELPLDLRNINALISDPADVALRRVVGAALQQERLVAHQAGVLGRGAVRGEPVISDVVEGGPPGGRQHGRPGRVVHPQEGRGEPESPGDALDGVGGRQVVIKCRA